MKKLGLYLGLTLFYFCHKACGYAIQTHAFNFYDKDRKRLIPVTMYVSAKAKTSTLKLPVVIINHGYTVGNTEYSFLANALAAKGYCVVSIQHDLKSDPPLAKTGNLFERRKPLWERGSANILYVIKELKHINPNLNLSKVILIGHSNGGDIAMQFASNHPQLVEKIVSLDSLRMPFPRTGKIPILSSIGKLKAGITFKNLNTCIILHCYSSNNKAIQKIGRALNYVEGEKAIIHIICLNNTIDVQWTQKGLSELNQNKITWKKENLK